MRGKEKEKKTPADWKKKKKNTCRTFQSASRV